MKPSVVLHVPSLKETELRQKWLSDPQTMSYNKAQPYEADGYDPSTGCIDFPMGDWRFWRDTWIRREPSRYSAYVQDEATGEFVGEACYFFDMERDAHGTGILIAHEYRGRGYGSAALKALVQRAFEQEAVEVLFAELPESREAAVRMYLSAGFREEVCEDGICLLVKEK